MPILKNFKPAPIIALDDLLPDPNGILSKIMPPSAIKIDSNEVSKVVDDEGNMSIQLPITETQIACISLFIRKYQ